MSDFDAMAARFTARVKEASDWKNNYVGAAYSSRIRAAIANLKEAIKEAELHPEISAPIPVAAIAKARRAESTETDQ